MEESLMDAELVQDPRNYIKRERKKLMWWAGSLAAFNGIGHPVNFAFGSISYAVEFSTLTTLLAIAFCGLLLGLLFGLMPYRKMNFSDRYVRASLFCMIILYAIWAALLLILLLLSFLVVI